MRSPWGSSVALISRNGRVATLFTASLLPHCMSPKLALNCRRGRRLSRQLLGVKRTRLPQASAATSDPKPTSAPEGWCWALAPEPVLNGCLPIDPPFAKAAEDATAQVWSGRAADAVRYGLSPPPRVLPGPPEHCFLAKRREGPDGAVDNLLHRSHVRQGPRSRPVPGRDSEANERLRPASRALECAARM
jgi:hypothetical protein